MTREQIEQATQAFLANGGEIQKMPERKSYTWADISTMLERILDQVDGIDDEVEAGGYDEAAVGV
jgi:hypothetical protein